jgi:2-polyprenyl-6-methoxyphenol hydroxylase-like FAD-dependent oxidoreductase
MPQKVLVIGAGPVGSLAALYAAVRGHEVEIHELRPGKWRWQGKLGGLVADCFRPTNIRGHV